MSPLGNVTSSAPDRNGKGNNQKMARQASLFISLLILSGSMIDTQSWREAVLKFRNARAAVSNGRAIPGMQRLSGACKLARGGRDCVVLPTPSIDGPYTLSDWQHTFRPFSTANHEGTVFSTVV
jgi:hypothetical protein